MVKMVGRQIVVEQLAPGLMDKRFPENFKVMLTRNSLFGANPKSTK